MATANRAGTLALFLLVSGGVLAGDSTTKDVGHLVLFPQPVAVGPVHPDWPLIVVAEIAPTRIEIGPETAEEEAVNRADRFKGLPRFEPPNGKRQWWKRTSGFYLAGPPGHPDDRIEVAEVVREGTKLTATIEGWRTRKPVPAGGVRRPTQVVVVKPLLEAGDYEMTVIWREYEPSPEHAPFWSLKAVRKANTRVTVYGEEVSEKAKTVALAADDFKPLTIPENEAARLWSPVPTVLRVGAGWKGFEGFAARANDAAAVAGTFDPTDWKTNLYAGADPDQLRKGDWPLARAAPVRPAKPTDPVYAVIYAPTEVNSDHCRLRAIEWKETGLLLHVHFFHTGFVNGSNFQSRAAYVVRLPAPQIGNPDERKPLTGKISVQVRWTVLNGERGYGFDAPPFRPLDKDEMFGGFGSVFKATPENPRPDWMDRGSRCELTITP